jgi:hypothetical protein
MPNKNFAEYSQNPDQYEIKTHYSGWGWFLFTIIGMSAKPSKVEFIDRISGEIVESTTNPDITKKFVGR